MKARFFPLTMALVLIALLLAAQTPAPADASDLRRRAYQMLSEGNAEAAVAHFQSYLRQEPGDVQAQLDLSSVLSRLGRHAEAAALLEDLRRAHPQHEPAYFRLGVEYLALNRVADAQTVFAALSQSANPSIASAASESLRQLRAETEKEERLKAQATVYDLAREGRHAEAVTAIGTIETRWGLNPDLEMQRLHALYELGQYEEGLRLADAMTPGRAQAADLSFLRAEYLVKLKRVEEAKEEWRGIERDQPGSLAALEARRRFQAFAAPTPQPPSEEDRFFALAREEKHAEVVAAIDGLEQRAGQLSHMMEMQRLYSLQALGQIGRATELADRLAATRPDDPDLAFVRAELRMKQNRPEEALALWRGIAATHAGSPAEAEAKRRMAALDQPPPIVPVTPPPPQPSPEVAERTREENRAFELANDRRHKDVVRAIDALELKYGPLPLPLELQRLYALQSLGQSAQVLDLTDRAMVTHPNSGDLVLIRADALIQTGRLREASESLARLESDQAGTAAAAGARRRLSSLPPRYDLGKNYWGEAYFSGDYLGRYGDLVGSGLARHGTFVPGARWLQPYVEFRFSVDTDSGGGRRQTIVADNFVGFYGGVRAQVLPTEYLFVYAQGGTEQDLLDNRNDGDWDYDYQAGIYGFKSWGPGMVFHGSAAHDQRFHWEQAGREGVTRLDVVSTNGFFWRGDWFVDGGADFSYYHRYSSWLGYGQAHQGFRVFQIGPTLALDAYAVEYLSWDVRGDYFDNLFSLGPGVRWIWRPCPAAEVILRGEYLAGWYLGRDDEDTRGGASGSFNGVQVGLSVGMRW